MLPGELPPAVVFSNRTTITTNIMDNKLPKNHRWVNIFRKPLINEQLAMSNEQWKIPVESLYGGRKGGTRRQREAIYAH
jgi:hypothetical protein